MGGYPQKYGPANDMFYNLKAACNTSIVLLPFEFMYYRKHSGQEINNKRNYLYNNFRYLRDALDTLALQISDSQRDWLRKKNKRRFIINVARFFFTTFNIKQTYKTYKMSEFTFKDFLEGVFH